MSNLIDEDGVRPALGAHSLTEILSQPRCWADCLERLDASRSIRDIGKPFAVSPEWVFIGCGSSYYVALAAAASWTAITGTRARALPASELLLFPDLALNRNKEFVSVLISRSGQTTEVLRAAQYLNENQIPTIAVSCVAGQELERLAIHSIILPEANEQSWVMTRSFTSMLLALEYLAATLVGKHELLQNFKALPLAAEKVLGELPGRVRELVNQNPFSDYVCLGQGPYYGVACESALKVTEMSRTYAQAFHTLEFRHGPKSIVSEATLITFLISEENQDAEVEVVEEIKKLGGKTLVVAKRICDRARSAADLAVDIDCALASPACLIPFAIPGQLIGFYTALYKGFDPDRPQNLSRVVLLADEN